MASHEHRYRKFNDALLFCTRCGTTKAVVSPTGWTVYRLNWPPQYYPYIPYWSTTGTTTTIWNGSSTLDPNVTYTLTTGETNAEGREVPSPTSEPEGHEDN